MRRRTRRVCCTTSPLRTRTPVLAPDPVKNCRASIRTSTPCPPGRRPHARTQRGSQHRLHGSSLAAARPHRTDPYRSSTGRASAVPRRAHRRVGPTFPPNLRHRCHHHWPCRHRGRRGHLRRRLHHDRRLHGPHQLHRTWSTVPSPRAVRPPPLLPPRLPPRLPRRSPPHRGRQRRHRAVRCLGACRRIRPLWKRSPPQCPSREVTRVRRRRPCLQTPLLVVRGDVLCLVSWKKRCRVAWSVYWCWWCCGECYYEIQDPASSV